MSWIALTAAQESALRSELIRAYARIAELEAELARRG